MMKRVLLMAAMLVTLTVYGQKKPDYRFSTIPGAKFFRALYKDDFIGDTLSVDGKIYFFSQSPMKQSYLYMMGEEDFRFVLVSLPPKDFIHTYGMPDKGYVLHFSVEKGKTAQVDRATFNGSIHKKEQGKRVDAVLLLNAMGEMNELMKRSEGYLEYPIAIPWLNGRYRLNDTQVVPGKQYQGKRYIAVFEHGMLKEIYPDTEKENFNPPLVDVSERPEGISPREYVYVPEHVYYEFPNGERQKEKLDVATKKWEQKVMDTFQTEPFLDRDCLEALRQMWIKK